MKDLKILFLFALAIFSSCDLDEDPPFLDDSVYSDPEIVVSTLDGIYAALTTYNAQERRLFVINGYSGFFNTRKQGGNINNPNNQNLFVISESKESLDSFLNTIVPVDIIAKEINAISFCDIFIFII